MGWDGMADWALFYMNVNLKSRGKERGVMWMLVSLLLVVVVSTYFLEIIHAQVSILYEKMIKIQST